MKGLAKSVDLSSLVGQQIEQIRIGRWSVQLLLEDDKKVVIESRISISSKTGDGLEIDDYSAFATEICATLESRIVEAYRAPDGGLKLKLSSGVSVHIQNSETQYESFQIHLESGVLVA